MIRNPFGVLDALFSIKTFAAAMLAYYIALRIGLPRPFWAVTTTYIVSQPLAGAVLSKAFFRVIGTALGASMAVLLVPNLANAPELLSLSLAIWLGLCVYFALLDRTTRSYIFLLAANPRTVVVVESGGAVLMPWLDKVGGVLEAWYPGERGGEAITSVVYGDVDATGRLPVTFPASAAQAPRPTPPGLDMMLKAMDTPRPNAPAAGQPGFDLSAGETSFPVEYPEGADAGYRWYQRTNAKPLFPFGYGLSYTRFSYAGLDVREDHGLHVRFTGTRAGSDVPQVYAAPSGGKAPRRLVGFQRVTLAPGVSQTVDVTVEPRMLESFETRRGTWARVLGPIAIGIGHDVEAIDLHGTATIAQ